MNKSIADLRPLEVAVKTYYWKPFAALFRALELRLYCLSRIVCNGPILDLCCGDGKVTLMLKELKVLPKPVCGLDYARAELEKAQKTGCHKNLLQASANQLPFKDESFSTIICNGSLECIPEGPDPSLKEIMRVLRKDGVLIATVPTDQFTEVLILPRLMKKISPAWSLMYIKQLNNRLPHFHVYSSKQWHSIFEKHGLTVVESKPFFSSRAGTIWNVLTLQFFRIFGFLQFINNRWVIILSSTLLKRGFQAIYEKEPDAESEFGYMFVVARKQHSS